MPVRDRIFMGSTFTPIDYPIRSALLLHEVARERQAALAVVAMKLRSRGRSELVEPLIARLAQPADARRAFVATPELRVWLKQAIRALGLAHTGAKQVIAAELDPLIQTFTQIKSSREASGPRVPGTPIRLVGHELSPLLATAIPPSCHILTVPERETPGPSNCTLTIAGEALAEALANIARSWPALHEDILRYVDCIVYLSGVGFHSCSAEPYTGAILLSDSIPTSADLQQSLVREYAHQVLYNVMELDPLLTNSSDEGSLALPWPGAPRDHHACFHAYFVDLIVALYLERIRDRPGPRPRQIAARLRRITLGLRKAQTQLDPAGFNARGHQLLTQLHAQVEALAARQRARAAPVASAL